MSLTAAEIVLANRALDVLASALIDTAQTGLPALACNRHFAQVRDSLLRSYEWNFANTRATLALLYTLTLETSPGPDAWVVGDVITGVTSGATATILTVTSSVEYEISYLDGTFTDGETITNGTVETLTWEGIPLTWEDEAIYWYDDTDQVVCGTGYPIVATVAPDFGYDYQYILPADFLRLRGRDSIHSLQHKHAIEGSRLLCNDSTKNILYVKKVTDPTLWDDLFTELFILKLAWRLMNPLAGTGTASLKADLREELRYAEARARLVSASEDNSTGQETFTLARYGN